MLTSAMRKLVVVITTAHAKLWSAVTCHRFAMVRLVEPIVLKPMPAASRCDQHRMREAFGMRKSSFALAQELFGIIYFDRSGDMI